MITPIRRLVPLFVAAATIASACGSTADDSTDLDAAAPTQTETGAQATATPEAPATDEPDSAEPAGTPAGATDDADGAVAPPADPVQQSIDPAESARLVARGMFNLEPDAAAIDCVLTEAEGSASLLAALESIEVVSFAFDDDQLQELMASYNGCLSGEALGAWATSVVGASGDSAATAPACFADRFDDPELGDPVFTNFVALALQYRVDPSSVPPLTSALVDCAPVGSLTPLIAGQIESSSSFQVEVDRACLAAELEAPEASETFYRTLIDGQGPPVAALDPYVVGCSAEVDADLAAELPADFVPWAGQGALADVRPSARAGAYTEAPPITIDATVEYEAVMTTAGGVIRVRLLADSAPVTVNNFVSLARDGFYDRTTFHRVIDGFMAQGGDPLGTGTGGPGYEFADEVDGGPAIDRAGLLAMANAGPDTNGSQFFITFAAADYLTGRHTVFGEVIEGQDVVDAIARRDPTAPVGRGQVLESVEIVER